MASKGYVEALLNKLDAKLRPSLIEIFAHVLETFRVGGLSHQEKAVNFHWVRFDSTTATTANEEFSIAHGLGGTPIHLIPYVPLDSSGTQYVRLKVTRPADANRIYLSSPDTRAPISVLVEF